MLGLPPASPLSLQVLQAHDGPSTPQQIIHQKCQPEHQGPVEEIPQSASGVSCKQLRRWPVSHGLFVVESMTASGHDTSLEAAVTMGPHQEVEVVKAKWDRHSKRSRHFVVTFLTMSVCLCVYVCVSDCCGHEGLALEPSCTSQREDAVQHRGVVYDCVASQGELT